MPATPISELEQYRAEKDQFFRTSTHSPLTRDQKRQFQGLSYFTENPDFVIEVPLERFEEADEIVMQTSTGGEQIFTRYGRIHFMVEGQEAQLTIYHSETGFFLPFVDSLAGKETYPAGRYLEPEMLAGDVFRVDFNLAYNPYCAYNENWSCPLTPFENRIKVPIRAGEKLPEGEWAIH
jgi:uncharacterized protein